MLVQTLACTLGFASVAFAHGGVLQYNIGGKLYDGWHPYNTPTGQNTIQRPWATYDPITDAMSSTVACNDDGTGGSQLTATVAAGQPIIAYWNQVWPHPQGPQMTYLANCNGACTGVNAKNLKWFKIDEAGLLSGTVGNGKWAAGKMIDNNCTWTTTIPASVPSGNYLIRFETIALHSLPAQIYPECAQITITGGGSRAPTASELVSFPGAYKNTDPGLSVNLYTQEAQTQTKYVIPGPPLYGSGSSGPGNPGQPESSTGSTPTSSSPPSTPTQPAGTIDRYGQCGGIGWSGSGGCKSPWTCQVINDYYFQCL